MVSKRQNKIDYKISFQKQFQGLEGKGMSANICLLSKKREKQSIATKLT